MTAPRHTCVLRVALPGVLPCLVPCLLMPHRPCPPHSRLPLHGSTGLRLGGPSGRASAPSPHARRSDGPPANGASSRRLRTGPRRVPRRPAAWTRDSRRVRRNGCTDVTAGAEHDVANVATSRRASAPPSFAPPQGASPWAHDGRPRGGKGRAKRSAGRACLQGRVTRSALTVLALLGTPLCPPACADPCHPMGLRPSCEGGRGGVKPRSS